MTAIPRIARAIPREPITRPESGLPVVVRLRWANGDDVDVLAIATAWTREAVEVRWQHLDEFRIDWVPAGDVRRNMNAPVHESERPPTSRGQLKKNRW